jgi:energy-coupling factor transporter ATP-binding protein EcfA2
MLEALDVKQFTVFSNATFSFGALNVIHGENSSGKTHMLKLAYSVVSSLVPGPNEQAGERPTKTAMDQRLGAKFVGVFRPDRGKLGRLARRIQGHNRAEVSADFGPGGKASFSFSTQSDRVVKTDRLPSAWLPQAPVFLPTRELLSVFPGFVSLYETQAIPFDEIWRDTCLLLGSPIARGPKKKEIAALLEPLETALGCKTSLEGDRFFMQMKTPNAKVEADLVAEGYRKLAMVARLIANGSLDDKGYLFWDEPEANLNPRLIKRLAPLLLGLAAGGVQVFIATHSLFLMRELEIEQTRRKTRLQSRYFGLHTEGDSVAVVQGETADESGDIASLDESLEQSDRYMSLV